MKKKEKLSNAQSWELEITCKNNEYLDAVIKAVLKHRIINFSVTNIEIVSNENEIEGKYIVYMECCWFSNLASISKDLLRIEKKLDKL